MTFPTNGGLEERVAALEAEVAALRSGTVGRSPTASPGLLDAVWRSAPLAVRLRFAADLLDGSHPLREPLREAAGLHDLWQKGEELETWIHTYPSLFVDAYEALTAAEEAQGDDAGRLAAAVLADTRATIDAALSARGLEWISPQPGDAVTEAHALSGSVPRRESDRVGVCLRPGLLSRGRVLLPAEVERWGDASSAPSAPAVSTAQPSAIPAVPAPPPAPVAADDAPAWLRALQRAAVADPSGVASLAALQRLNASGPAVTDLEVILALEPLLPMLGPPRFHSGEWAGAVTSCRDELLEWLQREIGASLIHPAERSAFDGLSMSEVGERRTAHAHEDGTVARVETVGVARGGRTLLPAKVTRYVAGGSW